MARSATRVTRAGVLLAGLLFTFSVPAASQEGGCTLTQGYWKTHPGAWPVELMLLGGVPYSQDQLIQVLSTSPRGDATYILAQQLIAAKLNVLNGADSSGIADTITNADAWLSSVGGLGTWPTDAAREAGLALAGALDAFNNGLSGVPHCEDGSAPPPPPPPDPLD